MAETDESPGDLFLRMHHGDLGFVMPNAWDPGSAILLASEGFCAIGTTSAGVAFSLGRPDYAAGSRMALSGDEMLAAVERVVSAVAIPVSADLESGYGDSPEQVAQTVRRAIGCGAAGCNIEDFDPLRRDLLAERDAMDRIRSARAEIAGNGRAFVLNARTDAVLQQGAQGLAAAIERGNRYLAAGADCVFVPGIADVPHAKLLVREITGPVNLVIGLTQASCSARALIDAGVKRVSVGGSIARAALGFVRSAARELREAGTTDYGAGQIPQGELNALFERAGAARADRRRLSGQGGLS